MAQPDFQNRIDKDREIRKKVAVDVEIRPEVKPTTYPVTQTRDGTNGTATFHKNWCNGNHTSTMTDITIENDGIKLLCRACKQELSFEKPTIISFLRRAKAVQDIEGLPAQVAALTSCVNDLGAFAANLDDHFVSQMKSLSELILATPKAVARAMEGNTLEKSTDVVARIIQEQLKTLSPAVAKAKREELHSLAVRLSTSKSQKRERKPKKH